MWPLKRRAETRAVETSHVWLVHGGEVRSLSSPDDQLREIFGLLQPGGIPSGAAAAMKYPASAACVRLISSLTAECPVHVYRRSSSDGRERVRDHIAEKLLNNFASPWQASTVFLRKMTVRALHEEHAYARVVRVGRDRRAKELQMLSGVRVECDDATGEPTYIVPKKGGGEDRLNFRDVLHLESPTGGAPSQQAAQAIQLGLQLELATLNLFRNGGRPSGILSFKQRVPADAAKEMLDAFQDGIEANANRIVSIGSDAQFTPLAMTSTDSETIENRKLQVLEVVRTYGVSPTLAGELADATLNNSESLGRQFVSYTLAPWLTAWVAAISRCLLTDSERDAETYVEFATAGLVSADLKARFEALRQAVGGPWMVPNEARALENQSAVDGGDKLNLPQGAPAPSGSESAA